MEETISSADSPDQPLSYRASGVDIDAGERLVEAIKPLARSTARPGAGAALGGFGGLFDLKAAGFQDPVLVAATDGVGTKLKIAIDTGQHQSVGIDLVAMCVNDLIVQGAEPLFFLDYYATSRLDAETARQVIVGIAEGCRQAGCALIGGETAEMPGMYQAGDYDVAGFAVGAAERSDLISELTARPGDLVLGLGSNGLHSNGFSLVRRVVERSGLAYEDAAPFESNLSLGEHLLRPTRIYVSSCLGVIRSGGVAGLAHITGGGLLENLPRVLPKDMSAALDGTTWDVPVEFDWLAEVGGMDHVEMTRTFNCGIGMAVIVRADQARRIESELRAAGERVSVIGEIWPRNEDGPQVTITGLDARWGG